MLFIDSVVIIKKCSKYTNNVNFLVTNSYQQIDSIDIY